MRRRHRDRARNCSCGHPTAPRVDGRARPMTARPPVRQTLCALNSFEEKRFDMHARVQDYGCASTTSSTSDRESLYEYSRVHHHQPYKNADDRRLQFIRHLHRTSYREPPRRRGPFSTPSRKIGSTKPAPDRREGVGGFYTSHRYPGILQKCKHPTRISSWILLVVYVCAGEWRWWARQARRVRERWMARVALPMRDDAAQTLAVRERLCEARDDSVRLCYIQL